MREVETRSMSNTTTPQWGQSFHMPIEDVSHVLRIIALHDAQKGETFKPQPHTFNPKPDAELQQRCWVS